MGCIRSRLGGSGRRSWVSLHRVLHLLCWRALEVQGVHLRSRRLASAAPCEGFQFGALQYWGCAKPRDQVRGGLSDCAVLPPGLVLACVADSAPVVSGTGPGLVIPPEDGVVRRSVGSVTGHAHDDRVVR